MKSIPDSLTPQQAWEKLSAFAPLPIEIKPLAEALHHCLATDFLATEDVPVGDRSFMDGYAVRTDDVQNVPARLHLIGEVLMGESPREPVKKGETVAIPTGGFLPPNSDAVVMQEDTELDGESVLIQKSVAYKDNVQHRAEDFRKDDLLFRRGHRLRAQDVSAIGTFGSHHVQVHRRPSLTMISTGNELVPFATHGAVGAKIRETNSLALCSAARTFHFDCHSLGIIPDELLAQRDAMQQALNRSDVVLVSGGSSVGVRDYTLEVIRSFDDSKIHFHGLAIRPGNPTIFASIGPRFVFGLPGQPVSSLIVFYMFVLPFLLHLSGEQIDYANFAQTIFRSRPAKLRKSITPLKTKTDYVRLKISNGAEPVLGKSASLSTLAFAEGFIIVPPGESPIEEGSVVNVILFP
jgi:molybdopterin molybdotransferase